MQAAQLAGKSRRAVRRALRVLPAAGVLAVVARLAAGGFSGLSRVGLWEALALTVLLAGMGTIAYDRLIADPHAGPRPQQELELGGLLVAASYVLIAVAGAWLHPLAYLTVGALVTFLPRSAGVALVAVAVVFEGVLAVEAGSWLAALPHGGFLVLFAALYHVILSGRIAWARKAETDAVKNRIREAEDRARTFRLISSGSRDSLPGMQEQEKWLLASVKEVEGAVGSTLEVAELALSAHTVGAFLLSPDDRYLKLHDCRSLSDSVSRGRIEAGEGVIGGVIKRRLPLRMHGADLKGVTWYDVNGPSPRAVVAAPIVEASGIVRGVVVADRVEDRPFEEREERLLETVAQEVLRAIEVERVLGYIRKTRDEKARFFSAIEELNRASSLDEVFDAVHGSACQLGGLELCAVTMVDEAAGKPQHSIVRITGVPEAPTLIGRRFAHENSLVDKVVRYGTPLPGRSLRAVEKSAIFDEEVAVKGLVALKIFPLKAGDRILGTLVAGSRKRGTLDEDVLRMLEVLAIQAAQAVLRANLYAQMERMATTDGMTGLLNHRTFQSRFDEVLSHAKRYGRSCVVMLTDIDHFKNVNDTYGHQTGDEVLKVIARILRESARDTDIVARYGGEEFAIVMPETDTKGAFVIAERIRERVQAETFQTDQGPLKLTMSLGIAECPKSTDDKHKLIELADQCLYHSKRNGRNQSVTVELMKAGRKGRPEAA